MPSLKIDHYSDVLCVWAYISQVRVKEACDNFPDDLIFSYHYFSVFGDVTNKMATQWAAKGGLDGYSDHVHELAAGFSHVHLHEQVWRDNVPNSSLPAHLFLSAAACLEQVDPAFTGAQQRLDSLVRTAFFELNLDPSDNDTLTQLVDEAMLPVDMLLSYMRSGEAHARLASGFQEAAAAGVRSSPTLTFNEGRQMLSGNVGYRILEANIQELLREPGDQQSWC